MNSLGVGIGGDSSLQPFKPSSSLDNVFLNGVRPEFLGDVYERLNRGGFTEALSNALIIPEGGSKGSRLTTAQVEAYTEQTASGYSSLPQRIPSHVARRIFEFVGKIYLSSSSLASLAGLATTSNEATTQNPPIGGAGGAAGSDGVWRGAGAGAGGDAGSDGASGVSHDLPESFLMTGSGLDEINAVNKTYYNVRNSRIHRILESIEEIVGVCDILARVNAFLEAASNIPNHIKSSSQYKLHCLMKMLTPTSDLKETHYREGIHSIVCIEQVLAAYADFKKLDDEAFLKCVANLKRSHGEFAPGLTDLADVKSWMEEPQNINPEIPPDVLEALPADEICFIKQNTITHLYLY